MVPVFPPNNDGELPAGAWLEGHTTTGAALHERHPATKTVLQRLQELLGAVHHPLVDLREYIVSEKFIWDDLLSKGEEAVTKVREQWQRSKTVPRMLISWPATHIEADDKIITNVVSLAIPPEMPSFKAAVELAKATNAYALLLIERVKTDAEDTVRIVLESHHGTRSWTMKVARHGDVTVLEKEKAASDTESIGVLWRPHSTPA